MKFRRDELHGRAQKVRLRLPEAPPDELKERAVRMVGKLWGQDPGDDSVIARVARQLGVGAESLRRG